MLKVACKYETQLKHINEIETEQKQKLLIWGMDQFLLTLPNKKLSFAFTIVQLLINWPLSMLFWQRRMRFSGRSHYGEASFVEDKFRMNLWTVSWDKIS